uniref:Uncharacterized protein n=1 Tax=Anguilla anguilla TaxID=7936 RepID=A0A0E9U335_ANGAN
MPWVLSFSII